MAQTPTAAPAHATPADYAIVAAIVVTLLASIAVFMLR